ncbi:MAG: TonB-dependent receptor [Ignavibacteriales bacterium]|nr:MAG: TonB-dependent receptor [Ignavibacteriales bacterium]
MKYFLLAALWIIPSIIYSQTGNIKGRVSDELSPIPSVNIILLDTQIGAASDAKGFYEIREIPVGEYEIKFSAVGYDSKTIDIEITQNRTLELNVILSAKIIEVQAVEVTGFKQQEQSDTRTSLIDLDPRDAKILPGAVEDVMRTLQSLPGVLAPSDFSSQLVIRGSGPDQNLILMDDVEIFNPYRLYGVISMFNPDAVSNIDLITGGFPAKYGDRLSAVLDVTNREGTDKKYFTGRINASIVDANVVLEGKNPFNLRGSWLVNSRRTYYDLVIEPFVKSAGLVDENTTFPNFYDFQGKLVIGPYSGHKFLINGIYSRDGVDVVSGRERNTPDSIGIYNVTKNDILSAAWHYAPSTKYFNKLVVSWYKNSGVTDFDSEILDPSLNRKDFEETIPDTLSPYLLGFKFNGDFSYRKFALDDRFTFLWGENTFEAGAGMDLMQTTLNFNFEIDPELEAFFASNPQFRAVLSDLRDVKNYNRYRAYVQNNFAISDKFNLQPSLRFDHYDILNKSYLAPRVSLAYALDDLTTLRAVWGVYYQSPGYERLRDRNVLYDLNDEYTHALDAERAMHYVLGVENWLTNEWSLRLEGYYKDFTNMMEQKIVSGHVYYTERVPGSDPRYASGWTQPVSFVGDSLTQIPINYSEGESYGLEVLIAKKNVAKGSRLTGWVSYALAFADHFEPGEKRPFRFDQRNTINVVLNYQVNDWFDIGVRWQYGSGFPYSEPLGVTPRIVLADYDYDGKPETPVIATRKNSGGESEVIYDVDYGQNKLNARRPAYHRLDVRLSALADYWDLDWTFYLDVINVYNRANVIGYDYYVKEDLTLGREPTNMFPIVPTLGFSVRF